MKTKELRKHITVRPEIRSDKYVIGHACNDYKTLPYFGETILDLGANIGTFSVLAALSGATRVYAFEPEPGNFKMLKTNTAAFEGVEVYEAAVTTSSADEVSFFLTKGNASVCHSVIQFKGRPEIKVANKNFAELLKETKATVIKMDIEGTEFDLLSEPLPDHVLDVAVEIHFNKPGNREIKFPALVEAFSKWKCVVEPKSTGKNWVTTAHWSRREQKPD